MAVLSRGLRLPQFTSVHLMECFTQKPKGRQAVQINSQPSHSSCTIFLFLSRLFFVHFPSADLQSTCLQAQKSQNFPYALFHMWVNVVGRIHSRKGLGSHNLCLYLNHVPDQLEGRLHRLFRPSMKRRFCFYDTNH